MTPETLRALAEHPKIAARVERLALGLLRLAGEVPAIHPSWLDRKLGEVSCRICDMADVSSRVKNAIDRRAFTIGPDRTVREAFLSGDLLRPRGHNFGKKTAADVLKILAQPCPPTTEGEGG